MGKIFKVMVVLLVVGALLLTVSGAVMAQEPPSFEDGPTACWSNCEVDGTGTR